MCDGWMGIWHDLGFLVIFFTTFIWAQSKLKIHLLKILSGMHSSGWLCWESALHFSGSRDRHYRRRDGTSLCRAAASHGLCLSNHRGTPEKLAQHCASGEPCKTEAWENYNTWVKWWHSGGWSIWTHLWWDIFSFLYIFLPYMVNCKTDHKFFLFLFPELLQWDFAASPIKKWRVYFSIFWIWI